MQKSILLHKGLKEFALIGMVHIISSVALRYSG